MSELFELQAESRKTLGKSPSRRMRRLEDRVPAVIYGAKETAQHISFDHNRILKALENEAFFSTILTINLAGKKQKAVIKAIQRHPYKPKVAHMDFQRISEKEKLTMHVPLHFLNEDKAPGLKKGGMISHLETSVIVSCLPANLPEFIEVEVSNLDLDHSIHLSDLQVPKGVELVDLSHDHNKAVVSIYIPRAAVEAKPEAAEAETPAATEEGKSE